jgi:UDP-N-acetylmuramate dehydrogenase
VTRLGDDDRAALLAAVGGDAAALRWDEPMARHTTLRVGGPADVWAEPGSVEALQAVVRTAAARGLPLRAVGAGSNLLVKDGGLRGVVLSTRRLRGLEREGATGVKVEAGVTTGKLLLSCTQWELGGVEFLGGVPGSVGGGLIMNAGTYLGEFVNVTTHVGSVRFADGDEVVRDAAACNFRYRASDLPGDEVVVWGRLELTPRPRAEIETVVRSLRDRRKEREPAGVHNAGSFFKNPPGEFAGRLIEACGLKGRREGGAEVSPKHANWLVQSGTATAADFLALIAVVRAEVERVHGVRLELEVKVIGED